MWVETISGKHNDRKLEKKRKQFEEREQEYKLQINDLKNQLFIAKQQEGERKSVLGAQPRNSTDSSYLKAKDFAAQRETFERSNTAENDDMLANLASNELVMEENMMGNFGDGEQRQSVISGMQS